MDRSWYDNRGPKVFMQQPLRRHRANRKPGKSTGRATGRDRDDRETGQEDHEMGKEDREMGQVLEDHEMGQEDHEMGQEDHEMGQEDYEMGLGVIGALVATNPGLLAGIS
jgi:hypothetical protein